MKEMIQRAALFNLEGATYLEDHNEQLALAAFNNALDCMSQAASSFYCTELLQQIAAASTLVSVLGPARAAELTESQWTTASTSETLSNWIPLMAVPKPSLDQTTEAMPVSFEADTEENPQHFVYRQGLVFHPEVARTPVDALFYSTVVIYNTALCFHQGAGNVDETSMMKAASLYDICLELLKESATRFNCAHIIISAMNNKACLHQCMGDFTKANKVLDQLLSVIVSSKGYSQAFSQADVEGILHNIVLLKSSCISPAA